jgi:hypothetical protein
MRLLSPKDTSDYKSEETLRRHSGHNSTFLTYLRHFKQQFSRDSSIAFKLSYDIMSTVQLLASTCSPGCITDIPILHFLLAYFLFS